MTYPEGKFLYYYLGIPVYFMVFVQRYFCKSSIIVKKKYESIISFDLQNCKDDNKTSFSKEEGEGGRRSPTAML